MSPADAALFSQSPLRGEIELLDVESTFNPSVAVSIWILVPAEDIQSALSDSLAAAGLLAEGEGQYELRALPRNLYGEAGSTRFTFTTAIDYRLVHSESGNEVFDDTVVTTREFSQAASWTYLAMIGEIERLMAANFSDMIDELAELQPQ